MREAVGKGGMQTGRLKLEFFFFFPFFLFSFFFQHHFIHSITVLHWFFFFSLLFLSFWEFTNCRLEIRHGVAVNVALL